MGVIRTFLRTRADGVNLYKTESDAGYYILQNETGVKYSSATDVEGAEYTYTETDELIPDRDATREELIKALAELGVEVTEDEET